MSDRMPCPRCGASTHSNSVSVWCASCGWGRNQHRGCIKCLLNIAHADPPPNVASLPDVGKDGSSRQGADRP